MRTACYRDRFRRERGRDNPDINKVFAEITALGHAGLSDDIEPTIASLPSEGNSWINARRIEVSGGQGT